MLNACIILKVVPTKAEKVLATVQKIKEVKKAYFTFWRFDIAVFVEVEIYKELRDIANQMNGIEGVRSTETLSEA